MSDTYKIIIERAKVKREVEFPFRLCGSRDALRRLATQILSQVDDENFVYGWIEIYPPIGEIMLDTPPRKWED